MPYIGLNFAKEFFIPNYIGESLAALIPSILSLIQGMGQDPGCYNYTDPLTNQTNLYPNNIVPTYSVKLYFFFMFGLLCISTTSFSLLNFSSYARKHRKSKSLIDEDDDDNNPVFADEISNKNGKKVSFSSAQSIGETSPQNDSTGYVNDSKAHQTEELARISAIKIRTNSREKFVLFAFTFCLSFLCYGVLPGLQSYSTLPYGTNSFN